MTSSSYLRVSSLNTQNLLRFVDCLLKISSLSDLPKLRVGDSVAIRRANTLGARERPSLRVVQERILTRARAALDLNLSRPLTWIWILNVNPNPIANIFPDCNARRLRATRAEHLFALLARSLRLVGLPALIEKDIGKGVGGLINQKTSALNESAGRFLPLGALEKMDYARCSRSQGDRLSDA